MYTKGIDHLDANTYPTHCSAYFCSELHSSAIEGDVEFCGYLSCAMEGNAYETDSGVSDPGINAVRRATRDRLNQMDEPNETVAPTISVTTVESMLLNESEGSHPGTQRMVEVPLSSSDEEVPSQGRDRQAVPQQDDQN